MNLKDLFTNYKEYADTRNWKVVNLKQYKEYIAVYPVDTIVANKALNVKFNVPAKKFVVCGPYGDIRLLEDSSVLNYLTDSTEQNIGQDVLRKHYKSYYVNDSKELQNVLPWTLIENQSYKQQNKVYLAIKLNKKKINNLIVQTNTTNAQFSDACPVANSPYANSKGDYLVAIVTPHDIRSDGQHNINPNNITVINERTFTEMFDMRAFPGENIETAPTAYDKPQELVKLTAPTEIKLTKTNAMDCITNMIKQQGLLVKISNTCKELLQKVSLNQDDNGHISFSAETDKQKSIGIISFDIHKADDNKLLRITVVNRADIEKLINNCQARVATLINKKQFIDVAQAGNYTDLSSYLENLKNK